MATTATQDQARPTTVPLARLTGAVLDRLFTPHGPAAYFRWVGSPTRAIEAPTEAPAPAPAAPAARNEAKSDDGARRAPSRRATVTLSPDALPDPVGEVRFQSSGLTAAASGTLLETAEAAGLEPRNRCRRGICGTCTTPKLSGTVVDARTGETSSAAGPIRICVSIPQGDVALDL